MKIPLLASNLDITFNKRVKAIILKKKPIDKQYGPRRLFKLVYDTTVPIACNLMQPLAWLTNIPLYYVTFMDAINRRIK